MCVRLLKDVVFPVAWAIGANALVFAAIVFKNPAYFYDFQPQINSDAGNFLLIGRNVILHGRFSKQPFEPFTPDHTRAPVYPVIAGLLTAPFGATWPLYVTQVFFHVATVCWLYVALKRYANVAQAKFAAIFLSVDPIVLLMNFQAMSEPLFLLVHTVCVGYWIRVIFVKQSELTYKSAVIGGLLLGVCTLVRVSSLYILPIFLGAAGYFHRHTTRNLCSKCVACLFSFVMLILPWVARNYLMLGYLGFVPAVEAETTYGIGAGAYAIAHGIDTDEAEKRIAEEYNLPTINMYSHPWKYGMSIGDIVERFRLERGQLWLDYWRYLPASAVSAIINAWISHNTNDLARLTGSTFSGPKRGNLRAGAWAAALAQLQQNPFWLNVAFIYYYAFLSCVIALAATGTIVALRSPNLRGIVIVLSLVALYYHASIALIGPEAYWRHRHMLAPLLALAASRALGWVRNKLQGNMLHINKYG